MTILNVPNQSAWSTFCELPDPDRLSIEQIQAHQPDASLIVSENSQPTARCSLWWRNTPSTANHRVGYIGHYTACDSQSGAQLLREACLRLKQQGCTQAIGPVNGNTWQRYRLLSERGSEPTFFLEPDNPEEWNSHFSQAGYEVVANYYSAINTDLNKRDTRVDRVTQRLQQNGVAVRSVDMTRLKQELQAFYALSIQSFANNFLYTPQTEEEFLSQYLPYQQYLDPRLILCAEHENQLVGFLFAIADWNQKLRGDDVDTVIIKTVAVRSGRAFAGLGAWMIQRMQDVARELGYQRSIFALMHETNQSLHICRRTGEVFRTYCLYAQDLSKASL